MNEEKEDLRRQVERLQGQITNLTNQLHQAQNECQRERTERCKLERLQMQHHKQVGPQGLEGWPIHFPPRMPNAAGATAAAAAAPPPVRDFQPVTPGFPWQSSFPQPRGARAVGESSRPPPENAADQSAAAAAAGGAGAGFGKRERQNIDPGKH
ncbi:hypothetical protein E3U43_001786 [Larimichthys crocea]|uniref:Uncharacterized protein n=1 Tax=Larimichthys crocea TaxID=215358 RepID=A0ACD3REF5_LARCR|nr:hypothetical protein E3U43_001786 [Larimichthys crocea]